MDLIDAFGLLAVAPARTDKLGPTLVDLTFVPWPQAGAYKFSLPVLLELG